MTSDFVTFCDAVITDLQANVSALSSTNARVHKYVPWNPEELQCEAGERSFAVWPLGEAETAELVATGSIHMTERYAVLVWEDASEETARGTLDETATSTFLQLHQDVRARFLDLDNATMGGSDLMVYSGTQFPEVPSKVRWFLIVLRAARPKAIAS